MFNNKIFKKDSVSKRPIQVSKEIKVIISDLLVKSQIKDAILFDASIIISEVITTNDLSYAKVYFYPLGNLLNSQDVLKALNKNAGIFRKHIGKKLHIRNIPELEFYLDNQFDRLEEVEEMFKKIQ